MTEAVRVLLARIVFVRGEEITQVELLPRLQFADRIFRQYHHAERADGFRNAMVDFRIDVVRTAGKHDASAAGFFHILKRFLAFFLHLHPADGKLLPAFGNRVADLRFRNPELRLAKGLNQLGGKRLLAGERHKRI